MKKKLALLMAAIMTVAMVPMTAFASTNYEVYDVPTVAEDANFTSTIELSRKNTGVDAKDFVKVKGDKYGEIDGFEVVVKLTNATFTEYDEDGLNYGKPNSVGVDKDYEMELDRYLPSSNVFDKTVTNNRGILKIDVRNDTTAIVTLNAGIFNNNDQTSSAEDPCILDILATAVEAGKDVTVTITGPSGFSTVRDVVIAEVVTDDVEITVDGVTTFVEDAEKTKTIKDIMIDGLVNGAITDETITLELKGNWTFTDDVETTTDVVVLNDPNVKITVDRVDDDEITLTFNQAVNEDILTHMIISGIELKADKSCSDGDKATIRVSSDDFDKVTLEVAQMVAESVTYSVEDDDLPVIWAGKAYDEENTLKVSVEENTGDILNTSRKATFTFPDGIEVVGIKMDGAPEVAPSDSTIYTGDVEDKYEIDENVVTIWNYQKKAGATESEHDKGKVDFEIEFVLNAAPSFSGDVDVTLGGEFDDVELTVATVKAPYTVEAKTSEVLIDYRYVPVNEIVITEAEDGILDDGDVIALEVEKMHFEDAGSYEVTTGDIEVDVNIDDLDDTDVLTVTVDDASTEASTITISGLELYLDRTLPVGGYALENIMANNILWENSRDFKDTYSEGEGDKKVWHYGYEENGLFKYDAYVCNDSYVEVVTAGRDQDDSSTTRKIVITIGATTMAVGTETVTLDTPAYINAENYTELPLRAVSEAFGATVGWDDASRTVTIMMGQRIVSMTIGSKTMYINGTPVAMNTAPEITNERTFVPVRDLANALGITKIDWNEASATVTLN